MAALATLLLLVAACGGGSEVTANATETTTPPTEATEELGSTAPDAASGGGGSAAGHATVSVGTETWEVELDNLCVVADQFMTFASTGDDGSGARVTGTFAADGSIGNINVLVDDPPLTWTSDPSHGGPIEFTLDHGHAEGTTTFEDGNGEQRPGTFDVTCEG